jgi:hypothetical protein
MSDPTFELPVGCGIVCSPSASASAPERTANTPGQASAFATSTLPMPAWACGDRTITACAACAKLRSSAYCPCPVTRRRSSRRNIGKSSCKRASGLIGFRYGCRTASPQEVHAKRISSASCGVWAYPIRMARGSRLPSSIVAPRSAFSMLLTPPSIHRSPFIVIGGHTPGIAAEVAARSRVPPDEASQT